jgi:hypothetical protein
MLAAIGSLLGLSELMAWPTEHLTDAADNWTATANRWYQVFTQIWQDSLSVDWQGNTAEQLHARTYADKAKVSGLADQLYAAATVARSGASDLEAVSVLPGSTSENLLTDKHTTVGCMWPPIRR